MKKTSGLITILCICMLAISSPVFAQECDFQPGSTGQDAFVCDCNPTATNPGSGVSTIYQGRWNACYIRSFFNWDISSLPEDAEISSAIMKLRCHSKDGTQSGQCAFYRALGAWEETSVTHANAPEYDLAGVKTMDWPEADEWISVDITDYVEFWHTNPDSNFGVMGSSVNVTGTFYIRLRSFESPRDTLSPKLTVTYTSKSSGVQTQKVNLPTAMQLSAYPNPFNPVTTLRYTIDSPCEVSLKVYNAAGTEIRELVNTSELPGMHRVQMNASDLPSGVYMARLAAGGRTAVTKLLLTR